MCKAARIVIGMLAIVMAWAAPVDAAIQAPVNARIKDVAKVQGVRANQLVGYGLVFGLAGSGDSNKSVNTVQSIVNMLRSFGVVVDQTTLQSKNVAAVMISAKLPAFVKPGDTIDVTVSSMGDAKSLAGGTLIQTPLRAANGAVYAVAQGAVTTGGFNAGGSGANGSKNRQQRISSPKTHCKSHDGTHKHHAFHAQVQIPCFFRNQFSKRRKEQRSSCNYCSS